MIRIDADSGVGVDRWDVQQAELGEAIIVAAQRRGPNKRHFAHRRTGSRSLHSTGSDLTKFVSVLNADVFSRAGRLATSVAEELLIRCSEVRGMAYFLKRSLRVTSVVSISEASRLRSIR